MYEEIPTPYETVVDQRTLQHQQRSGSGILAVKEVAAASPTSSSSLRSSAKSSPRLAVKAEKAKAKAKQVRVVEAEAQWMDSEV